MSIATSESSAPVAALLLERPVPRPLAEMHGFAIEASMPQPSETRSHGRLHQLAVLTGAALVILVYVWLPLVLFARIVLLPVSAALIGASGGVLIVVAVIGAILHATTAGSAVSRQLPRHAE